MPIQIRLYARKDCCLCEAMKEIVQQAGSKYELCIEEVDVDAAPDLRDQYGHEVPVMFINGRKAFKFQVTARELEKRLRRES